MYINKNADQVHFAEGGYQFLTEWIKGNVSEWAGRGSSVRRSHSELEPLTDQTVGKLNWINQIRPPPLIWQQQSVNERIAAIITEFTV